MPGEESMTLNELEKHLRLPKTRHLTASIAGSGPQIAGIKGGSRDRVGSLL